jgi:hypothetical protein
VKLPDRSQIITGTVALMILSALTWLLALAASAPHSG